MPFVSKAQARFMYAVHPEIAKEFQKKTLSIKALPEHKRKMPKVEADDSVEDKKDPKDKKKEEADGKD